MMTVALVDRKVRKEIFENIKYFHFDLGEGQVTVALHDGTVANAMDTAALVAASFCTPGDNFERREGRMRSMRRLLSSPSLLNLATLKPEEELAMKPFRKDDGSLNLLGKGLLAAMRLSRDVVAQRVSENKNPEQVKWMNLTKLVPRGRVPKKKD